MWWLAACATGFPPPTTVQGLQVVAIVTNPPQPTSLQNLEVEVWVADALGLGADVLVWMCTPVDGRCIEFDALPGSDGLPLLFVAQTGIAEPVFRTTVAWPLLADIATDYVDVPEEQGYGLLVWALACVPGQCEVIREVRADPVAGSHRWWHATEQLSDPSLVLDEVGPHEASVAVKYVPLWGSPQPGDTYLLPNSAPTLDALDTSTRDPRGPTPFRWLDPDLDDVSLQAFTTAGGIAVAEEQQNTAYLIARPTSRGVFGDRFLVAEDGRGGTAVWSSQLEDAARSACEPTIRLPIGPGPGDPHPIPAYATEIPVEFVGFDLPGQFAAAIRDRRGATLYSAEWRPMDYGYGAYEAATSRYGYTTTPYTSVRDRCDPLPQAMYLFPLQTIDVCALGGQLLTLTVTAQDHDGRTTTLEVPFVAAHPSYSAIDCG